MRAARLTLAGSERRFELQDVPDRSLGRVRSSSSS